MNTNVYGYQLPSSWKSAIVTIWIGQAFSIFATTAATFAIVWHVTVTNGSPLYLALVGIAVLLPTGLLSPFGGVVADRYHKKRVMILADGIAGSMSLLLALFVLAFENNLYLMLLVLVVRSCAQAFHAPAFSALAPRMVPEKHLVRINALDQFVAGGAGIAGPAIGIFFYITFGFQAVLFLDAACAAIACLTVAICRVPQDSANKESENRPIHELKEGIEVLRADRGLLAIIVFSTIALVIFLPLSTLSPIVTYSWFNATAWDAALIEALASIGLLVGSVVLFAWGGGKGYLLRIFLISGALIGIVMSVCGLLPQNTFLVFAALIMLAFISVGFFNGPLMPLVAKRVSEDKMGRVMGLFLTCSSLATPLGLAAAGLCAEVIGVRAYMVVGGILLVVAMLVAVCFKSIRELDKEHINLKAVPAPEENPES